MFFGKTLNQACLRSLGDSKSCNLDNDIDAPQFSILGRLSNFAFRVKQSDIDINERIRRPRRSLTWALA
jgi:hypothetical protein